jgi:hypothetical protein
MRVEIMSEWWHDTVLGAFETIILVGGVMTAIGLGIKRIYNVARSVEKILEFTVDEKKQRELLAADLKAHIHMEDSRDRVRDQQIVELVDTVREIGREVRPNGGSSMKDVLNHTAERVGDIHSRVSVLEEWKRLKS